MPKKDKPYRGRCRSGIVEFMGHHWRWVLLAAYFFIVHWGWQNRHYVFTNIPISGLVHTIYVIALTLLYGVLAVIWLVVIAKDIRAPFYWRLKFKRCFKQIGLKNSVEEYPCLKSVCRDKNKPHGMIFKLASRGITPSDIDGKVANITSAIGLSIYCIDWGKKTTSIYLYAMAQKHHKPTIISVHENWLLKDFINLLCVGATGTGKSYALLTYLRLLADIPNVSITVCDFKKSSFAQFEDTANFYGYEDSVDGIKEFYKEFAERLEANNMQRNSQVRVLLIDEYGALVASQDKKVADEIKTMVGNMLFMGRSLGIKVLIGVQRADSEHFKGGARDQFRAILALGNLSKEQKQMLFSDYKDKMNAKNGVGEGYLRVDGREIERVKVAKIDHMMNDSIRDAMCR